MRFVWAVIAFLAAVGLIGAGVMQLSQLRGADTVTSEIAVPDEDLAYTVIDADVLAAYPGQQGLTVSGTDEEIFVSYGRTSDMQAWLSDTSYNHATLDDAAPTAADDATEEEQGPEVSTEVVTATNEFEDTGERVWWNPRAADVWVEEMTADGEFQQDFTLPDGMSLLLATDGQKPAPSTISVTWETGEVAAPWAGPLIAAGCVALLIGLIFWILGFVHMRRRRGPRRKGTTPPKTPRGGRSAEPPATDRPTTEQLPAGSEKADADTSGSEKPGSDKAGSGKDGSDKTGSEKPESSGDKGSRARSRRRILTAAPALTVGAALLVGCSPSAWPDFAEEPTPTPTPEPTEPAQGETPALTQSQAERIVADMAQVTSDANKNLDAEMGSKRLIGEALEIRKTSYEIRKDVEDWPLPDTVPEGPVSVLLPQANDGWPRTALMVVGDGESEEPPTILTATQPSPWEMYKVSYMGAISANTELPKLAPAYLGAALVPPDSSFLQVAPKDLAAAYADAIEKGEDSEFSDVFVDAESDPFRAALKQKRIDTREKLSESGADTAKIDFNTRARDADPIALATFDSGAIVAVSMLDTETVEPTVEDGLIRDLQPEIQHFVGEEETETGVRTAFASELFFFVPAKASDDPVRLLGFSYALSGSELLPEPEDEEE